MGSVTEKQTGWQTHRLRKPRDVPATEEFVIDRATGEIRQAGATQAGRWISNFKQAAESSLYVFAKGVLGLTRLTPALHLPVSNWLQSIPPLRKGLLLPRDHLKTSLGVRAMPLHMAIQTADSNCYMPGFEGRSMRVLIAGEKAENAENQLRWIRLQCESNARLRAFWPQCFWEDAKRQSPKWSEKALSLPRTHAYPESTFETIGVGGAITGRHYNVLLKDDLVTFEAANSVVVMQEAIEWNKASRALFDDHEKGLEFVIGTKWANYDLYTDIQDNDPSVVWLTRQVIEDGKPIFPEFFSKKTIDELQHTLGGRFFLLYMNTAVDPSLSEFDIDDLRFYETSPNNPGMLLFDDDPRDLAIEEQDNVPTPPEVTGMRLNADTYDFMKSRAGFIRRARAS
jgi:hypothetical protein